MKFKEVKDLKEQVSDLMRHFETQHAIEKAPAEMQQVSLSCKFYV